MTVATKFVQPLTKHAAKAWRGWLQRTSKTEAEIDLHMQPAMFGITLRQHYAAHALQGILAAGGRDAMRDAVTDALLAADLMVEQESQQ